MKQIQAYIKPHMLNEVTLALQKIEGLRGMSVVDTRGFGRKKEGKRAYPDIDELLDFAQYAKIEIFCQDDLVNELVSVIDRAAYTGLRGDGKIYVTDVVIAWKIGKGMIRKEEL